MAGIDSKIQGFLEKNREFAETWKKPATMEQMRSKAFDSGGRLVILTCLDPRVVPEQFFGPELNTPVIRNAGGRVNKDVITSIALLRSLANMKAVLVIHHTDCGATHLTDDGIREDARTRTPDAAEEIDATESYGCYTAADFEKTLMIDVDALRHSKLLAGIEIRGLALDTETGLVRELEV
ncbi:MAG: hypothetical protein Q9161_006894 [Pseudevernia consocians]